MLRNRRGFARIKATILLAVLIVVLAVVGVTFLKNRQNTGDSYKQHIGKGRSGERYQCYKISV